MARITVLGTHAVATDLRTLVREDATLVATARAHFARVVVSLVPSAPGEPLVTMHVSDRLQPAQQAVLTALVQLVPHVLVKADYNADAREVVVAVSSEATEQQEWTVAHALYRGVLKAVGVAPARDSAQPSWWARLRSRAAGKRS